jgi:Concanavalin A-like lectin/glucanases superfamily
MTTGFVGTGLSVQVAFNDNVWATSPTWTDITRYVQQIQTSMGRQHELQQVNPSTAVITLYNGPTGRGSANNGGQFSPWNTASPYYNSGNGLTPGHPVRIRQTISATTYHVFYGYTQSWVPKYTGTMSQVVLNCYDGMALLNLAMMDEDIYSSQVIADGAVAYWDCQDPAGNLTFEDATGNGNTARLIGGGQFGGVGALAATVDSCFVFEGGGLGTLLTPPTGGGAPNAVMFEGWFNSTQSFPTMSWYSTHSSIVSGVEFFADPSTGLPTLITDVSGAHSTLLQGSNSILDGKWHQVVVQVPVTDSSSTWTLYVDGQLVGSAAGFLSNWATAGIFTALGFLAGGLWYETASGPNFAFDGKGSMDQVSYYTTPLTADQVATHYELVTAGFVVQDSGARVQAILAAFAGIPMGLINCDTGTVDLQGSTSSLSTTTIASYLQQVVNTERGILYQDTTGVLQFKNRQYVYTNSTSTTSQMTLTYHHAAGEQFIPDNFAPGIDDTDLWNDITVARQGGGPQRVVDSASITANGRRTLQGYTSLLFENDTDAQYLAQGLIFQYGSPQPRVRAISSSSTINNTAGLPLILGLDLLDRVTIVWNALDGSSVDFSQQSLVEQITHTITPGRWDTTLAVTPIGTEPVLILNSSSEGLLNTNLLGF